MFRKVLFLSIAVFGIFSFLLEVYGSERSFKNKVDDWYDWSKEYWSDWSRKALRYKKALGY